MWWSYIVTFIGSLIVAITSVCIAQRWSAKREYTKSLKNLKAELLSNIRVSSLIHQWVDMNIKALGEGKLVAASCPHFYNMGWIQVRGALYASDSKSAIELEDLYLQAGVANDLITTMEELKWGVADAMTDARVRRKTVLETLREIVKEIVLPKFQKADKLIDSILRS